jgi:hypothetical protein
MGWECSTRAGDENCMRNCIRRTENERTVPKSYGIVQKCILRDLKEWVVECGLVP